MGQRYPSYRSVRVYPYCVIGIVGSLHTSGLLLRLHAISCHIENQTIYTSINSSDWYGFSKVSGSTSFPALLPKISGLSGPDPGAFYMQGMLCIPKLGPLLTFWTRIAKGVSRSSFTISLFGEMGQIS